LCPFAANLLSVPFGGFTEICHFGSDGFCLFASKTSDLTSRNHVDSQGVKKFFHGF
jgi:hypothetical protein